jgi:hypothetical protein
MRWYAILRTAAADLSPIAGLPYVMVGGGAMSAHGLRSSGGDTDVLMMSDVAEQAMEALSAAGWVVTRTAGGFQAAKGAENADFLTEHAMMLGAELGPEGVSEAIGSSSGHVMSKPWLLVTKIMASRDKDLPDMSLLMSGMSPRDVSRARAIARNYAPWVDDIIESETLMAREGVMWGAPAPA